MLKQYLFFVVYLVVGSVEIKLQINYEELVKVYVLKVFSL